MKEIGRSYIEDLLQLRTGAHRNIEIWTIEHMYQDKRIIYYKTTQQQVNGTMQ